MGDELAEDHGIPGIQPERSEVDGLGWFTADEAATLPLASHTRRLVQDAFADDAKARFTAPSWRPPA